MGICVNNDFSLNEMVTFRWRQLRSQIWEVSSRLVLFEQLHFHCDDLCRVNEMSRLLWASSDLEMRAKWKCVEQTPARWQKKMVITRQQSSNSFVPQFWSFLVLLLFQDFKLSANQWWYNLYHYIEFLLPIVTTICVQKHYFLALGCFTSND